MDGYASHLEALVETALTTSGSILELGCGDYSTPVLQAVARAQHRKLLIQASNAEWGNKFGAEIIHWEKWTPPEGPWGMVFLDSEEHTRNRYRRLPAIAKVTSVIVLHDANEQKYWDVLEGWKWTLYDRYKPLTAVFRCIR